MMEFEELLHPTFIAMSPTVVLERHQRILEKYGMDNLIKRNEFKRAREMYETARYAIGMTARTNKFYWVTPGKKNETPDTYIIWMENQSKKIFAECVEVVQWERHVNDMFEIIGKKISKIYPSNFVILIHVAREGDHIDSQYFADLHHRLQNCKISSGAVRFWSSITNKGDKDTLVAELYPTDSYTEFQTSYILNSYPASQQITKIDVISQPSRIIFKEEDFDIVLPVLPKL